MRIVIDMQGAQTESRFRGIGRYTLAMAQAIVRNRGVHEIHLALSGLFPDTIDPIRTAFAGVLSQEHIHVWYAPGPVRECQPGNEWRREVAELIREAFLASLKPDVIHVTSLFEGYVDDAVTSLGRFDVNTPVAVSLFDLIPLLNPTQYLAPNPKYGEYYGRKISYLRKAAVLLAISNSSRDEGLRHLGIAAAAIKNVSTAIDNGFQPLHLSEADAVLVRNEFKISVPFVLYAGGADERKNLTRLLDAWALLPLQLRSTHQLVFAGKMPQGDVLRLKREASLAGILGPELIFTGYIADDVLIQLYNLCKLFVFPSWHEGFGLPVLEAMACGAAVLAANTSSLPEVIGRPDALFDPFDTTAMAEKITQALDDEQFRTELKEHGLRQAVTFTWDDCARRAITAFEELVRTDTSPDTCGVATQPRKRLALVSPVPPAQTGIADYTAELLPVLAKYYDVVLVSEQHGAVGEWSEANGPIRDAQWLVDNVQQIDRVLYQIGNSPFHQYMPELLKRVPGMVVLHDFYLSGAYLESHGVESNVWGRVLYETHGYLALQDRHRGGDDASVRQTYACNLEVVQAALGVVVHSQYSKRLGSALYGEPFTRHWSVIPHLRASKERVGRDHARACLGLQRDQFVVATFGFIDPTKLSQRLLATWLRSELAQDPKCVLIFVGQNHGGEYGAQIVTTIRFHAMEGRIHIAGWSDETTFRNYLLASDLAVQLRTSSRGETSGTVLDCMSFGLPVIVNANGSFAELHSDAVVMLSDDFEDDQLQAALVRLWRDSGQRDRLSAEASKIISELHRPEVCATQYFHAIESRYSRPAARVANLVNAIANIWKHDSQSFELIETVQALSDSFPERKPLRSFCIDVSATCRVDHKTGIERVVRSLVLALLNSPPAGYRVEPVYLTQEGGRWLYRYARRYTLALLDCPQDALNDDVVAFRNGDVVLGLDNSGHMLVEAEASQLFSLIRTHGVRVYFLVYDLLPILLPKAFPPGTSANYERWLAAVARMDGVAAISQAVAEDFNRWRAASSERVSGSLTVGWLHLGADIEKSGATFGLPLDVELVLTRLRERPTFLLVGTIEPRKGYMQVLDAFSLLWNAGQDVNLVIVGKEGWKALPVEMRRDIPEIVSRLSEKNSPRTKHLVWLHDVSDEYLEKIYACSTCLIAASEGEGFGLPLIESARHCVPIIARDIPVFHEVAGEFAFYFDGVDPEALASAIVEWLRLYRLAAHPLSTKMPWLTWQQSAARIIEVIGCTNASPVS